MSDPAVLGTCDCPNDCESIRYTYSVSSIPLDAEAVCRENVDLFGAAELAGLPTLMRNFERDTGNLDVSMNAVCLRKVGELAFVKLQLAEETATKYKKELRVTLSDQISNFGQ